MKSNTYLAHFVLNFSTLAAILFNSGDYLSDSSTNSRTSHL